MAKIVRRTHVLKDLRPYVCTVEHCEEPTTQFESRRSYMTHELQLHEKRKRRDELFVVRAWMETATYTCVFCGEDLGPSFNKRERHVGQHMEEIAFAVVSKPYEEWDFYSDCSSTSLSKRVLASGEPRFKTEPRHQ